MPPIDPEALERRAAAEATAGLVRRLRVLTGRALLLWGAVNESQHGHAAEMLAVELAAVSTADVPPAVQTAAQAAMIAGALDAATRLSVTGPAGMVLSPALRSAVRRSDTGARKELRKAARIMRSAKTLSDVQAAMAVASRSVTRADAAARFTVNFALSEGVRTVNQAAGALDLWIAERDACLHCLAHQGLMVAAGGAFPNVSFARLPLAGGRSRPPLHPRCRCRIVSHRPEWGTEYPDALKREAQRSVLRGWSRPSESERRRVQAAADLLHRTALPKSVQSYARTAVRRGRFPKGRTFPALPRGR